MKHELPRGILHRGASETEPGPARYWPAADLAPFVEHFWIVRWDLIEPRVVETLPHPSIHLVLEAGRSEVVGVMTRRFTRELRGRGRVVGTKFRPGAFRPFLAQPAAALTDRRTPVGELFGARADRHCAMAHRHDDDLSSIAVVEGLLRSRRPVADEAMALAGRVARRIAEDREVTRVDRLAAAFETTVRSLQRLFAEYVGVSPKRVIQRYRLIEAVERVPAEGRVDWVDLALELGFADQAHFIRAFKSTIGRTPAEYARRLRA